MSPGARCPLPAVIAWRFLRGRSSRLLDGTARAALAATAIGVTAMVIAMALMSGYRHDLQAKLLGGSAGVTAFPLSWPESEVSAETRAALRGIPGVDAVRVVAYAEGSLASAREPEGLEVTIRGVDPGDTAFEADTGALAAPADLPAILAGRELADRLRAVEGEALRLMVLGFPSGHPRFRYQSVRLAGTFETGFADFDRSMVLCDRALVGALTGPEGAHTLYELVIADLDQTARVSAAAAALLGDDFLVSDWRDLNRELFTALELQQVALFFVLGLIVLVSTFNVASTLVVLVRERMREIGVLAALGLDPWRLRAVFLVYGGALGCAGAALGAAVGVLVAWLLTEFELIRFDADVAAIYFLSSVPFRIRPQDLAAVMGFTLVVTLVACWLPARRAASVNPSAALRYE